MSEICNRIIEFDNILFFCRIRPHIPSVKDTEPLLELDRDEKKFDIFLTFHRSSLLVSDLKIFLPFTINLDPYLKKVIKGENIDRTTHSLVYPFVCHVYFYFICKCQSFCFGS